jgi:hypothetical protein
MQVIAATGTLYLDAEDSMESFVSRFYYSRLDVKGNHAE